jgi:hypothetical protein
MITDMVKKTHTRKPFIPPNVVRLLTAAAAIGIGIFVGAIVIQSRAATFAAVSEAENGTKSGNATTVSDASASGSSAVRFGNSTSSSSTCTNPTYTIPMNPNDPQAGASIGNFYLTNDTWNAAGYNVASTMYICDYNNWYAIVKEDNNAHDGAVKSYPNVHQDFINWDTGAMPKISSYHTISSSFAENSPRIGIYEWTYDIWLNGVADNNSTEIMIWHDNLSQTPSGSIVATFSDAGRTYDVWKTGTYIAFVDRSNVTSGTVNLLNFFNFVISKGWIPSTSTIGQIDYGPEMVSTNGTNAKFEVTNFSLTAN